jgi:hypothetical protein
MVAIEAKCAKCRVTVAITEIRSAGYTFEMKPGLALADHCPVIIERKEAGQPSKADECPNLSRAIDARIEQFRKEQP